MPELSHAMENVTGWQMGPPINIGNMCLTRGKSISNRIEWGYPREV